jgi:transcriptional regulator with XRE-family HTH domain
MTNTIEPIADHLKRRLREAGASRFEAIAEHTGVALSFIRKFVYGSRENPRIQTIQPLLDFFAAVDAGAVDLNALAAAKQAATA